MKKIAFVSAFVLGLFSISFAQFSIGPRLGANYSTISTDAASTTTTSIPGFHGGLEVNYKFAKPLSVQLDALLSIQGGDRKYVEVLDDGSGLIVTNTIETKSSLTYLSVPVMINYEIPFKKKRLVPYRMGESKTSLRLYGGGYFGYGLSGTSDTKTTIHTENSAGMQTVDDVVTNTSGDFGGNLVVNTIEYQILTLNPIDFGATFGAGLSFAVTEKNRLFVDLRYNLGFANVVKVNQTAINAINDAFPGFEVQPETAKNRFLQLSLAYTVSLSKKRYANR